MTPVPVPALPETSTVLCVFLILLVPLAIAGIALVNTGLSRSHSAAHLLLASLGAFAVAVAVFFVCGFAWQGYIGLPGHVLVVAGKPWNWIAARHFFFRALPLDGSRASLAALLGMFSVALAALIPLGSGAGRWRLSASCASTAILAGWTFPLFAHWVWGGGWLAQLGVNTGLGRGFVDAGGAASIQVVGGLTALSIAWILGPRQGKYSPDGMPAAIPGHDAVMVLFGCLLALVGWVGLNSAGAILFTGAEPGHVVLIAVNTILAPCASGFTAAVITRIWFGRPDVSISANGWVGGLVAISAACAFVIPAVAIFIGLVAGGLVTFAVMWFEAGLGVDDPAGAISVHAVSGIWGLLALGLFARFPSQFFNVERNISSPAAAGDSGQLLAQLVGIATLVGLVLPMTYGLNLLLGLFCPHRVAAEGERQGLDLYELGAGAYPEFVTHTDEFTSVKSRPDTGFIRRSHE